MVASAPRNIWLIGHYGQGNTGDDALLYVSLQRLSAVWPECRFTVLSDRDLVVPPGIRVERALPGRGPLGKAVTRTTAILRADGLVYGGGGMFQDYGSPFYLRRQYVTVRTAAMLRKPVLLVGVGVGPLATPAGRHYAEYILDRAAYVSLREAPPEGLARRRIETAGDMGLLLEAPGLRLRSMAGLGHGGENGPARVVLGLSIVPLSSAIYGLHARPEGVLDEIGRGLARSLAGRADVLIKALVFQQGHDEAPLKRVLSHLRPEQWRVEPYDPDPRRVLGGVAECTHFLATRLHSAVFAYRAGLPLAAIVYHRKVGGFADHVQLPEEWRLHPDGLTEGRVAETVDRLLARSAPTAALPVEEAVADAQRNMIGVERWGRRGASGRV